MGSDQWEQICSWRDYRELGKLVRFLVFPRPHPPRPVRGLRITPVPLRFDLSATEIRKRVKQRKSIRGMVLPSVEKLIQNSRSYR